MKTLIFSDNTLWGCLNFRGYIIEQFIKQGYNCVIVAPCDPHLSAADLPKGVIFEPVLMQRTGSNPFHDYKYYKHLKAIYKKYQPLVVFHYTIKPNIYGTLVANSLKIPSITIVTGLGYAFDNDSIKAKIGRTLYKYSLRKAKKVLFLNSDNYQLLLNLGYVKQNQAMLLLGGEGVDTDKIVSKSFEDNKPMVFLMVARVLYDKGYAEYVTAAKANPEASFHLIGAIDSNPLAVPLDVVKNEKSIKYLGFLPNSEVLSHISTASCVVLPSYHEGMSVVLSEALSLSRPIITTNVAGCKETVDDKVNGYLVSPKDGDQLSKACKDFISLPYTEKLSMSQASRKKAIDTFDVKKVYEIYKNIIKSL